MKSYNSLLRECTSKSSYFPCKMNGQHYTRLFPILLGASRSRAKLLTSFMTTSSSTQLESNVFNEKDLEKNPYYKKYVEKIKKLETTNPIEYQRRMKLLESMHTPVTAKKDKPFEAGNKTLVSEEAPRMNDSKPSNLEQSTASRGLDSIVNMEKMELLNAEEIRSLWIQHYANKDAVCAVIPSDVYNSIEMIACAYPVFVYPVPRQDGFEMYVGQFASHEFHFSSLVNYQRHQANAPSQLSLKHYTELQRKKGIVLMSGFIHDDGLAVTDAQLLSYLIQYFYNEHPDLVKDFNESPNTFDVNAIINAMDGALLSKAGNLNK